MTVREQLFPSPRRQPVRFALSCFLLLWVALLAMPGLLFAERLDHGAIHVYSHHSPTGLDDDLRRADALLDRSTINDPALTQRIYLTSSHYEFAVFAPAARHALGVTYHVLNNTFLSPSAPIADTIQSDRPFLHQRALSAVIAHERTHALLEHHFGLLRLIMMPAWKQEGYCDYIAGSSSVGTNANGLRLLAQPGKKDPSVLYFRDTLRVRYLLDHDNLGVDQLFLQSFDTADLDRKAIAFAAS
jgi:hypothetical protein